jgi:hypothetical protein
VVHLIYLRKIIVQNNGSLMALSQRKTTVAILRGVLGSIHGQEKRFAKLAHRSVSWVKKVSAKKVPLSEGAARILEHETGVSFEWLLGSPKKPIVDDAGYSYDRKVFEWHRAHIKEGKWSSFPGFTLFEFVPAIAAIGAAACKKAELSLFLWRLRSFIQQAEEEFGTNDFARELISIQLGRSELRSVFISDEGFELSEAQIKRLRRSIQEANKTAPAPGKKIKMHCKSSEPEMRKKR